MRGSVALCRDRAVSAPAAPRLGFSAREPGAGALAAAVAWRGGGPAAGPDWHGPRVLFYRDISVAVQAAWAPSTRTFGLAASLLLWL